MNSSAPQLIEKIDKNSSPGTKRSVNFLGEEVASVRGGRILKECIRRRIIEKKAVKSISCVIVMNSLDAFLRRKEK